MKKAIIIILVIVVLAAAIGGFLVWKNNSKYISKDQALSIAVTDANLNPMNVTDIDVDFENDHGIAYYEVEFNEGLIEHKYYINALDGTIIDSKTEID